MVGDQRSYESRGSQEWERYSVQSRKGCDPRGMGGVGT